MKILVSPLLHFMQLREIQPYAVNPQLGIKGSKHNSRNTINALYFAKKFNEWNTIQLKLKINRLYQEYKIETIEKNFEEYDPNCTGTQVNFVIDDVNNDKNDPTSPKNDLYPEEMDADEDFLNLKILLLKL